MSLTTLSATDLIGQLHEFDTVIDARSEGEFDEDHLPAAINWPTLNNDERREIGTLYKQVNAFEAKKRGAAIAARNIAGHIDREVIDKPKDWKPLAYCWRGGKRSGSLSLILSEIGFRVTLLEGGYKAFRAAVVADIPRWASSLQFRVICGTTGSGKTRLLQALGAQGAQVVDLEALANHRSSVLGAIPGLPKPWPTTAVRCWAPFRAYRNPRKNALTRWCGTPCGIWTPHARSSSRAKAKRWAMWPCRSR